MSATTSTLRIGRIDYTNAWPLFYYFQPTDLQSNIEIISSLPSQLNQLLATRKLDISPISAYAYGVSRNEYALLPNLSVSAYGCVNSILLFLKKPLQVALQGTIALTTSSATSTHLLKIIATKFYHTQPTYLPMDPDLEQMMKHADATLLIGDHAIQAYWHNTKYEVLDVGQLWQQWTGKWMTFAVWAVHKDVLIQHETDIKRITEAFAMSKHKSRQQLHSLIQHAIALIGGTSEYWRHYFSTLHYDFGQPQQEGLQLYFQYAYELGLLDHPVSLEPVGENI